MTANKNGSTVSPTINPQKSKESNLREDTKKTVHSKESTVVNVNKGTDLNTPDQVKLFNVRTANQCINDAKGKPIPNKMFGELWFENEMCILFAETGAGKSILAVQIGNDISSGNTSIPVLPCEAPAQTVLYFDYELSDKQFERRYSIVDEARKVCHSHYQFSDNFLRVELNPDADIPEAFRDFDDYLIYSIEETIVETGAKVVIVDNITYLKNETEKAKDALPLMKRLNALKKKYGLSILVLAHTPKRDQSRPITVNDISGSKMLSNFTDSIFAVGQSSKDVSVRYIKQIKQRNTENSYGMDNVIEVMLTKPGNFLHLQLQGFSAEGEHLKVFDNSDRNELEERVKAILDREPDKKPYAIARDLYDGDPRKFDSFKVKIIRLHKRLSPAV